jgi:hypothetical protein
MRTVTALILILAGSLFTEALAQEKVTEQKPSTELELFLQTKGQIIVKEFHEIGKISGQHGAGLTVGTLILSEPGSYSKKRKGLRIEVMDAGTHDREHTSFLDIDEIDSMIKGLAYMSTLSDEWKDKPKEYTEVVISTNGNFKVGFYSSKGALQAFVKSGSMGSADAALSMDSLGTLKTLSEKGLEYLNSH